MAYGCRSTCDNCRPKYVYCPACGKKNFLVLSSCTKCGAELTEEAKQEAIAEWEKKAETREITACYSGLTAKRPSPPA